MVFERGIEIRESFPPAFWDIIKDSKFSAMHRALGCESSFIKQLLCFSSNFLFETSSVILCSPVTGKGLTVAYYWFVLPQLNKAMGSSGRISRKSWQWINEDVLQYSPPQSTEEFHRESCPASFTQELIPDGEVTVANLSERENVEWNHLDLSRGVWLRGGFERLFADWES